MLFRGDYAGTKIIINYYLFSARLRFCIHVYTKIDFFPRLFCSVECLFLSLERLSFPGKKTNYEMKILLSQETSLLSSEWLPEIN